MPKKLYTFEAKVILNPEKGGGWMASWLLTNDQDDSSVGEISPWKNPSAAKKWLKVKAAEKTPRKSVKMVPGSELDEKGKPTRFDGVFTFREPK